MFLIIKERSQLKGLLRQAPRIQIKLPSQITNATILMDNSMHPKIDILHLETLIMLEPIYTRSTKMNPDSQEALLEPINNKSTREPNPTTIQGSQTQRKTASTLP